MRCGGPVTSAARHWPRFHAGDWVRHHTFGLGRIDSWRMSPGEFAKYAVEFGEDFGLIEDVTESELVHGATRAIPPPAPARLPTIARDDASRLVEVLIEHVALLRREADGLERMLREAGHVE
jgi:hypothetical protein